MSYSKIIDPAIKLKDQLMERLSDGTPVVYDAGCAEMKRYRFYWINTQELQAEIDAIQGSGSGSGWIIRGTPSRVPVHDVIDDLFNATIDLYRYVES